MYQTRIKFQKAALSILLLLLTFCIFSNRAHAELYQQDNKKVTFVKKQIRLSDLFKEIRKQTGLIIFYNNTVLNDQQKVDVNFDKTPITKVMALLLDKRDISYEFKGKFILLKKSPPKPITEGKDLNSKSTAGSSTEQQHIVIRGKIENEKGEPLSGVSIRIDGSREGTLSTSNGEFKLAISSRDFERSPVLDITYVGFLPKKIKVTGQRMQTIALARKDNELEQLVVVGYGTQKKATVTSAISQVSGDEIRKTPATSIQNQLAGKLPGLFTIQRNGSPDASGAAEVYIRGISSFTGASQQPLILVDNVEYNLGQLFLIDPNEIKSISILKDAAATAIYGIKGANGVILVTTRRGVVGKPVINFKTQWSQQTPVHRLHTLNSYLTAKLTNEAMINDGQTPKFTDEDLELFKNHQDPYGHPDVDWSDVLLKNHAITTNNNLDISGGTKRVRYFVNLGYMWQNGFLKDIPYHGKDPEGLATSVNNNYYAKRYKFRSNLDIQATNTLDFQVDITGTYEEENRPEADGGALQHIYQMGYLNPYSYPLYNPDGSFGWTNPVWGVPQGYNNFAGTIALGGYHRVFNDFIDVHLNGTQKLDQLTKGLSLKGEIAYSFSNTATKTLSRGEHFPSYYYNPLDSTYTPRDPNVVRVYPYSQDYAKGTPNRRLNVQGSVAYNRTFGKHHVDGLLLFNQNSYTNGSNPAVNFRGYTFRLGYNYREKYIFQVSGAYNGSSKFVTQNRFALFPAFSAGYNLSREPFFKHALPFFSNFKLRGSLGWVGNDNIGGSYLYQSAYNRTGTVSFGETNNTVNRITEGQLGDLDVSWETERKGEIGLDFGMFHGKLRGSLDYFDNFRYDILTARHTIPLYFGVIRSNLPPVNIGKVSNKGYEIELTYHDKIGEVGILVKGNFSYAKNKVVFRDEPIPKYPWQKATGHPIGTPKQYIWTGTFYQDQQDIDTSAVPVGTVQPGWLKYKDLNGDGVINIDDMAYVGKPNLPNTNIGLTLGADYKGFSLSVLLQSALNFDLLPGRSLAVPFFAGLQPIDLERWTPETATTATFPALTTNFAGTYMNPEGNPSTFWNISGNYLRIRSASLAYKLPIHFVKKTGLSSARVFLNGYNLFTWSKAIKRYQLDPEKGNSSEFVINPVERIINIGMNITF